MAATIRAEENCWHFFGGRLIEHLAPLRIKDRRYDPPSLFFPGLAPKPVSISILRIILILIRVRWRRWLFRHMRRVLSQKDYLVCPTMVTEAVERNYHIALHIRPVDHIRRYYSGRAEYLPVAV